MSSVGASVIDALGWFRAHRFFHDLSPRQRVVLSQLPLALTMILVLVIVLAFHSELMLDPLFQYGLALHAVMFVLSWAIPWGRLPAAASLAIPILDFVPISLVRTAGVETIPAVGAIAVLPVVWLASAQIYPRFNLMVCFVGPLLVVWVPLLVAGEPSAEGLSVVVLLPVLMFATGYAVHILSSSRAHQQHTLERARGELQLALESSAKKERLLNTIVDAVGVGVLAMDADGKVTLTNRQQERNHKLELPVQTVDAGPGPVRIFTRGGNEELSPELYPDKRAARGESFSEYLVWVGERGEQRVFSTSARAVTDGTRLDGSVVTSTDVTALVEAVTAKDAFLSNVTHELRTPLTSILGYVDMLADQPGLRPEAEEIVAVLSRNAERLQRLVSDLLTAASGSVDVHPEPADLGEVIRFSVAAAAPHAAAAGVVLVNEAEASIPAMIDPVRMGQVLDNLLSNAIKYSPGGGAVTVSGGSIGGSVVCGVADTGIGMTEEEVNAVFTKFFRAEAVRRSEIPGVGLGLAITKAIVENHGGIIGCTSTPGKGTKFAFSLRDGS